MTERSRTPPLLLTRLRELLTYDRDSGWFTWNPAAAAYGKRRTGTRAGWVSYRGYRWIEIDGRAYQEHRLAWFYVFGRWPAGQVDHRNLNRADNWLDNLREANNAENQWNTRAKRNSQTGIKGVWPKGDIFVAAIQTGEGKPKCLGRFPTIEQAKAAYDAAARSLHGEFVRAD